MINLFHTFLRANVTFWGIARSEASTWSASQHFIQHLRAQSPVKPGWIKTLVTGTESVPPPAVHDAPMTAVGKSTRLSPSGDLLVVAL